MQGILYTRNVTKAFGGIKACDSIDLNLEKGKITALIGPNGAGKTTLFEIISGLQNPDAGFVHFKEQNITKLKPHKIARLGIARTFQQVRLFKNLELKHHIEFAIDNKDESFFRNIFSRTNIQEHNIRKALDKVGLDKNANTLANDLSYDQRKLLDLAISLAKPHDLLMLDEPVAGVTPALREEIKEMLLQEKKDGKTVLLIEHDMNFVADIADVVYVLANGKIIAKGKPEDVLKDKMVLDVYLGE